jgi:hypothetical protein
LSASPALSAQSRDWRPDDRAVLGDFTRITAVAASIDRVYAATPSAVLIWNPQFRQWQGLFTPQEPGMLDRVFAGLPDPLDNSLWLARSDGWVHFSPEIQLWERGVAPATVLEIAFDAEQPASALFLRTTNGWYSISRGGGAALPATAPRRAIRPATPGDAIRANPALQANSSAILMSGRMRVARYTTAAQGFGQRGWFLGTSGIGLLFVEDGAALPTRLTFGLPGDDIGALFAAPGGVWAINQRTANQDAALSFVSTDLNEFRWLQGPGANGYPFLQARRLAGHNKDLWAATDVGLVRFDQGSGSYDLYDEGVGLPDRRVLDLAVRRGQMAVGTASGVALLDDSLRVQRLATGFTGAAAAVAIDGDTVWVGTDYGLAVAVAGNTGLLQPAALKQSPAYQAPVIQIVWAGDTLVALTEDRMLWRNPGTGAWTLGASLSGPLGRIRAAVPYRDGFFVAGQRGFGFARLTTQVLRSFETPGDLPGEVTSLAIDDSFLWVGTRRGLVRFRLEAIRP